MRALVGRRVVVRGRGGAAADPTHRRRRGATLGDVLFEAVGDVHVAVEPSVEGAEVEDNTEAPIENESDGPVESPTDAES